MQLSALILDDHSDWVEYLERVLRDADTRITPAFSDDEGKHAVLTAAQLGAPLDLVTSDLRHPDIGGIGFLRWLRSLPNNFVVKDGLRAAKVPVAILSASTSMYSAREVVSIDASVPLLSKAEISPKSLLRSIEATLTDYRRRVLAELQDLGMAVMYEGGRYTLAEAYTTQDRLIETTYAMGIQSELGAASRKLIVASDRLSAGEQAVQEFEWLLNQRQTTETDLHRFLVRCPEFLLGAEFGWYWSEPTLKHEGSSRNIRPDFVLQPHDASLSWNWAVVDLKSPSVPLLRRSQFHADFTVNVHRVITQLKDYAEYFEDPANADTLRRRFGGYIPKPRLIAVIGRLPRDRDRYANIRRRVPDVYITTYDELLESRKVQLRRLREVAAR